MPTIQIADRLVGDGQPCFVVAEIGINHNGSLEICRKLIEAAAHAGADAVKFQKRTVDVVYSAEELARPRTSPFGETNGDLKRALEFAESDYWQIDGWCRRLGLLWFASPWDEYSVSFLERFHVPCHKVASACLTDDGLLRKLRNTGQPILLSTGMSEEWQIAGASDLLAGWVDAGRLNNDRYALLHCTSTYPTEFEELNLRCIPALRQRYAVPVGYSGHEKGFAPTLAGVALGASLVERHLTLDRSLWGSDQAASLEPHEFGEMVQQIRQIEAALGDGVKRVYDSELPIREKLRRVDSQAQPKCPAPA